MKTSKPILAIISSIAFFLAACQNKAIPSSTTLLPTSAFTESISIQQQKEAILQEIHEIVDQYNIFLEEEKATGTYIIVQLLNGSEGVKFTGETATKVYREMIQAEYSINDLNLSYYALSVQENPSISYPNSTMKASELENLRKEYPEWLMNEILNGSKVTLVDSDGLNHDFFIGDSYVAIQEMAFKVAMNLEASGPPNLEYVNWDIRNIQRVERKKAQVKFYAPSWYVSSWYEANGKHYIIDVYSHQIIQITPLISPSPSEGLSMQELEKIALETIALVSPNLDITSLTPNHGSKSGNYFFQWENTKLTFPDKSHPLVLVGLTGKGELFTYRNTLFTPPP